MITQIFARLVAWIGAAMILARRWKEPDTPIPAMGGAPHIPEAKGQKIFTLKMPTARGWIDGHTPTAAPGLHVNAFATDLKHPRWIYVLPNDDVLVAEALPTPWAVKSAFEYAQLATMKRAAAVGESANRITLFRDRSNSGVADVRETFIENQNQPFGMALINSTFYIGNTDGITSFDYVPGSSKLSGAGKKLVDFKPGGHWTRSLLSNIDGTKLYAGVGSESNIAENGMQAEEGRAAIYELDIALLLGTNRGRSSSPRPGACGYSINTGLRSGRPYCIARFMLATCRHVDWIRHSRHGHRPAWFVEPQHA